MTHEGYAVIQPLVPELDRRDAPALDGTWTSASVDLTVADLTDLLRRAGCGPAT